MTSALTTTEPTMSSKEFEEITGKRHDSIRRTMLSLKDKELIQLTQTVEVNHLGQKVDVYRVNQRDSYVVMAQLSPEFTARLVDRWQELEKAAAKPQFQIPQTYAEALLLAANQAKQLELSQPKVDFVDNVVEQSKGMITLGNYGRVLKNEGFNTGQKKIFKQLRGLGVILPGKPIPYDCYINRGYFTVAEKITRDRVDPVTYVTGKGQLWVHKQLQKHLQ